MGVSYANRGQSLAHTISVAKLVHLKQPCFVMSVFEQV